MRLLEQYCEDMILEARDYSPVAERETELHALMKILCRRSKNNPALIGNPGVGKTAIVEALAQRLASGAVPELLRGKKLYSLNMAELLAGTKYRGEFEQRVQEVIEEVNRSRDVILFVDEMHTLVGAGNAEGAIDAANLLKPALSRGKIQLIGATTLEEYRKHIEPDAALERRFCPLQIREPTAQQARAMLDVLVPRLESHYKLKFSPQSLDAAVELSIRYLPDRFLPDKALDLLEESAAGLLLSEQRREQGQLQRELEQAVQVRSYERAAILRDRLSGLLRRQPGTTEAENTVLPEHIAAVVSEKTGIRLGTLQARERDTLKTLSQQLSRRIIGQNRAIQDVCQAVVRGRTGLADGARPAASFLFLGPTGVGKTELCRQLAISAFGSEKALIRVDMTEYMEPGSVTRLLGAPPGYVGYEKGSAFTEQVRRNPYSVILFDEVEKAHPDIMGLLLQILDDGRLTDSMGRTVSFRTAMVVMTSNLGSGEGIRTGLGFSPQTETERLHQILRRSFRPELLGRIDCTTVFAPLQADSLEKIAVLQLENLQSRCEKQQIALSWEPCVPKLLAQACRPEDNGARGLRHLLQTRIESEAAALFLQAGAPCSLLVTGTNGQISVVFQHESRNRTNVQNS